MDAQLAQDLVAEFTTIWEPLVFLAIGLAFMFAVKVIRDLMTPFNDNHEIEERGNLAVAVRRFGLFFGLGLGLVGAYFGISSEDQALGLLAEIQSFAIDGAIASVMLIGVAFFSDLIILHGVNNNDEVQGGNIAVGLVEAGSYLATGLILAGAFSGDGGGILSAVVFALLGWVAMLVLYWVYEIFTPFKVLDEIKSGNTSAGVAVGGMLIALGAILRGSIAGDSQGWVVDLSTFAFYVVASIVIFWVVRFGVDRLFLPNTNLAKEIAEDRNASALTLAYGVIIPLAFLISFMI
jgi:uncharacterized membrane protein YjfL (UPF0719 family)